MSTTFQTTAQRLSTLAVLYEQGQASQLMDRTLDKLLAQEAEQCRVQLAEMEADMAVFERQFAMTSAEFMRRYQAGETVDRMDFVEWASLVHMRDNQLQRLGLLTGENAA